MKQKLLVICGGQSSEHSISRLSCTSILNNLDMEKYELTLVGIDKNGAWYILDQNQKDLSKDTWLDNSKDRRPVWPLEDSGCCISCPARTLRRRRYDSGTS